jgi:hypothetical protein
MDLWNTETPVDCDGFTVCSPSPMGEANARLIAASPDLLVAAQRALDYLQSLPYEPSIHPSTKAQDALHDAIAKAEGR